MNLIKIFGLTTVAVAAVMALVGVTSASAVTELEQVVLCKVKEDPCSIGNTLPESTTVHSELVSGTKSVLLSSLGNIECGVSTALALTFANQHLAHGQIVALTFTTCTLGGGSCTVEAEHLDYLVRGELNQAHTAYEVLVTEVAPNGQPQMHAICGKLVDCKFGETNVLLEALLDEVNHDTVLDVLQTLNRSGGLCPATSVWHAKYLTRCLEGNKLIACWLKME